MAVPPDRQTVDLSQYPDLVVIYLGMRVKAFKGLKTLLGLGPQIDKAGDARPDGLLHWENAIVFSLFPLHVGIRWYWRDFESLERWARSEPHRIWWQKFVRDTGGTAFWHETYFMRGGMEAIYNDRGRLHGLQAFAPIVPARGPMFSARTRLRVAGETPAQPAGGAEHEIYS
jgi:hypothetical protein